MSTPTIVGIGGTTRPGSSSEVAIRRSLAAAEAVGARSSLFLAGDLQFPLYDPNVAERTPKARSFVEAISRADGLIIGSPGYHGAMSGLVKNALDYLEDLNDGDPPYLDGRAVGCVACGAGWQATASTLNGLRSVVHALRGWPTPLGVVINSTSGQIADGAIIDPVLDSQLDTLGRQVVEFSQRNALVS